MSYVSNYCLWCYDSNTSCFGGILHLLIFDLHTFVAPDVVLIFCCMLGVGQLWVLTFQLMGADDSLANSVLCFLFEGGGYWLLVFGSLMDLVDGFVLQISGCFVFGCLCGDFMGILLLDSKNSGFAFGQRYRTFYVCLYL